MIETVEEKLPDPSILVIPYPSVEKLADERLGVGRSDKPDDHVSQGDHVLDLHAEQGPEAITGKIGKQVPVIPEVGDDDTGREQPDTGLYDTYPAVRFACPRLI